MADRVHGTPILLVTYNVVRHETHVLVKTVELLPDGTICKLPGGSIPRGCTISTRTKPLSQYVTEAFHGGVHGYVLPGNVVLGEAIPISAQDFVLEGGVDRTAGTLKYQEGPATLTFDHDTSPYAATTFETHEGFVELLIKLFPLVFANAAWGAYDSSGSFIYTVDGEQLTGRRGFHMVFGVKDAREIQSFSLRLFKHLWLLGHGYIHVSRDGKALPRTLFDAKVHEAQQPLFAGGAHCVDCVQTRPNPVWHGGEYLNTAALSELTLEQERTYQRLVADAKRLAKPECDRRRREYVKTAVEKLVTEHDMTLQRAHQTVESRLGGTLIGEDRLNFDDFGIVTVADVLSDAEKYDEATLADPIDGGSANKAILFVNPYTGVPQIYSHAHGGTHYLLKHDLPSLLIWLAGVPDSDLANLWFVPLPYSELRADESEQYYVAVKQRTGISISALRRTAKDMDIKAKNASMSEMDQDPGIYIARELVDQRYAGGRHLICYQGGQFWAYGGTRWAQIADSVLRSQLQVIAETQWKHLKKMWAWLGKKPSTLSSLVDGCLHSLANLVVVAGDPLGLSRPRPSVVNCLNGELWLESGGPELRDHKPESYLTSCCSIAYDSDAVAPTWELAVRGMLSHPGGMPFDDQDLMLRYIEELLGYVIQARRNLKVFVLFMGPGDNGKSQLIRVVANILGNDAIAFDRLAGVSDNSSRFATSRLVGKLAIVDDDMDHESLLPDGLLKKIAEEKPLTAEQKYKDAFTFVAQVVPILLANSWPKSRDLTHGMQTRAQVIHLPRRFLKPSECKPDHPDIQRPELWTTIHTDEMAGVLNRLIDAYYGLAKRGAFAPPSSAKRAFEQWLMDANVVARFLSDACEPLEADQPGALSSTFYKAFCKWAEDGGVLPRHRPQSNQMKQRLVDIGLKVEHTHDGTTVFGFRPKTEWLVFVIGDPVISKQKAADKARPARLRSPGEKITPIRRQRGGNIGG